MRSGEAVKEVELETAFDLAGLAPADLERMVEAGNRVVNVHRILAKTNDNVVGELLKNEDTFYEWNHFPKGDVYDHETHGQYYYHAHAMADRFSGEHGHFHTFLRPKGMPMGLKPADVPGAIIPEGSNDALSHLIAISMDKSGLPFRLFTVNRWVTAETWYKADDVIAMLDYFNIDHARPSWPVNCWITDLLRLFRPQIEALIHSRDVMIAASQASNPGVDIFEDRSIEVTSFVDISIDSQMQALAAAIQG